jgi:hypothetical protein
MSPDPHLAGSRTILVLYYGSAFLILGLILGLSVAQAVGGEGVHWEVSVSSHVPVPAHERAPVLTLESLTCFTCHSLERYRNGGGEAFPHDFHLDLLGMEGCHGCHVFVHHSPAPVELELCADCH